jgi:hypothetical protein
MSLRNTAFVCCLALTTAALAGACEPIAQQYPECGAFDFGDLQRPPELVDDAAHPVDCGRFRVTGPLEMPAVDDPAALDCAIDHLAEGQAMRVELDHEPDDAWGRSAAIFSDVAGVAMRWQRINEDLATDYAATVLELDVDDFQDCQDHTSAGERFTCFQDALDAGDAVDTCGSRRVMSE